MLSARRACALPGCLVPYTPLARRFCGGAAAAATQHTCTHLTARSPPASHRYDAPAISTRAHHAVGPSPRDGSTPAPPQERHARGLRYGAALSPRRLERAPAALSGDCTNDPIDDAAERAEGRLPGDAHVYERGRCGYYGRRGRREGPPRDCGRRAARGSVRVARDEELVDGRRAEARGGVRGVPARERAARANSVLY